MREFARCNDDALFDYLAQRHVTTSFLHEIDQFLRGNIGDLEKHASEFLELVNSLPPLEAYLYFIKGYTRPARYLDGIIVTNPFSVHSHIDFRSVRYTQDDELDDFFAGFEYRYDILDRIDREVQFACDVILKDMPIPPELMRLVCYAIFGNPVDAYKFYEYNYQQEYMPHRYLPEHVVLLDVPKPEDYVEPEPSKLQGWRKHRYVRERMARAKDQGVGKLFPNEWLSRILLPWVLVPFGAAF